MKDALIATLQIMSWLGLILGMLTMVNTICGIIYNTSNKGEKFSIQKLGKGLAKAITFYVSSSLIAIAFTMLPFINDMITKVFAIELIKTEMLTTLSTTAVFGTVTAAIVAQGKRALEGIQNLSKATTDVEKITWNVEIPKEDEENK